MDFYNHTKKLFAEGAYTIANLKVVLVSGYSFLPSETALTAITAAEVSGNGWPVGGEVIANATLTITTTDDATLDGDNISVTATGGDIGPADALVIVDATSGKPLLYSVFPSTQTAGVGTPLLVTWAAAGIVQWA